MSGEGIFFIVLLILGVPLIFCLWIWLPISIERMQRKPPSYVTHLLNQLPPGWRLVSYTWQGLDWEAFLGIGDRIFVLSTDQGRIGADELVDGELKPLPPQPIVRETLIPKTLVERLIEASKN